MALKRRYTNVYQKLSLQCIKYKHGIQFVRDGHPRPKQTSQIHDLLIQIQTRQIYGHLKLLQKGIDLWSSNTTCITSKFDS